MPLAAEMPAPVKATPFQAEERIFAACSMGVIWVPS
jgi:hypothetical protein